MFPFRDPHLPGVAVSASGRLAPHETLELHELLRFYTEGLFKMKQMIGMVTDSHLREIYRKGIRIKEQHIQEIMHVLQHRSYIS